MYLLFLAPFSWGTQKREAAAPKVKRLLYGRGLCCSGGAVKAEAAKCVLCIPNAGPRAQEFGPSSAQENEWLKKGSDPTQ